MPNPTMHTLFHPIRVVRLPAALLALTFATSLQPLALRAQTTATPADDTLVLSRFEVRAKTDKSYNISSATAGLKTRQDLIDIPGSIQIVPRNLIEDLGNFPYPSDFVKYAASGVASFGANNLFYLRGERLTRTFKNGIEYFPSVDDDVTTETVEVVKGAQAVLFGTRPVTQGMLLRTTKNPLYSFKGTLRAMVDSNGLIRGEVDLTGPLSQTFAGAKAAYRVVGAGQEGKLAQDGLFDNRAVIAPSLQLDWKDTTVRLRYEYSRIRTSGLFANNFLNEKNEISFISGRDQGYKAPWAFSVFTKNEFEATVIHRFTRDFESKLQVGYFSEDRGDHDNRLAINNAILLGPNGVVDSTDVLRFNLITLAQMQKMFSVVNDYIVEFDLGSRHQQTNFGWAASSVADEQALAFTAMISPQTGTTSFPIINPDFGPDIPDAALPGSVNTVQRRDAANVYILHQTHLLKDKLIATLAGSWSWASNISRLDVVNPVIKESKGDKGVYRAGLVYKPRADLSFFASKATNFVPSGADDRDQTGTPLPPSIGTVTEFGVKTAAFNGKVTGSIVWFENVTSNLPVRFNLGTPQVYALAAGVATAKGVEYDLSLRPIEGLNIIATLFDGSGPRDQTGARLPRTYTSTYSLLAKYDFQNDALKGFGVGGNFFHLGSLTQSGAPEIPGHEVYNAFVTYTHKNWYFNLGVMNITDKIFYEGGNSRFSAQPATPRTISLSTKYSF